MTHARAGTPQRLGAELMFYGVPVAVGLGEPQYGASVGYSGGERRLTQAVVKYVHADRRLVISSLPCWSYPDPGTFRNWLLHFPPVLAGREHDTEVAALHE